MPDLKDPFTMVYGVQMMLFEALIPTPAEQSCTVVRIHHPCYIVASVAMRHLEPPFVFCDPWVGPVLRIPWSGHDELCESYTRLR